MVSGRLSPEDSVQKNWYAGYGRTAGIIVMSKEKLFFIEEKGFFTKTFNIILEIPYNQIREVSVMNLGLLISDINGRKYIFTTKVNAATVKTSLEELMPIPGSAT